MSNESSVSIELQNEVTEMQMATLGDEQASTLETYTKRAGTAAVGQLYEIKLLTMVLFRLLHDPNIDNFCLGTNVQEAGAFDDLTVRINVQGKSHIMFIQAKHRKEGHFINFNDLINARDTKGDFNLKKYFQSYLKIRYMISPNSEVDVFRGDLDETELELIIFTPAKLMYKHDEVKSKFTDEANKMYTKQSGKILQIKYNQALADSFEVFHKKIIAEILAKLLTLHKYDKTDLAEGIKKLQTEHVLSKYCHKKTNFNSEDLLRLQSNQTIMNVRVDKKIVDNILNILDKPFLPSNVEHAFLVKDFLERFKFYSEQATEDNLGAIIRGNIKAKKYENDDLIYSKSNDAVECWWKQSVQAPFLTEKCTFFEMTAFEVELEKMHLTSVKWVKSKCIIFQKDNAENSQWANYYMQHHKNDLFFMNIFSSTSDLSCIKLVQYLQHLETRFKFVIIDDVELNHVLEVLEKSKPNLLVLVYYSGTDRTTFDSIRQSIKNIIIVTKHEYSGDWTSIEDKTESLLDLELNCQNKLLERSVLFQGYSVTLKEVLDSAPNTFVDAVTLQMLINREQLVLSDGILDRNESVPYDAEMRLLSPRKKVFNPMTDVHDKVVVVQAEPGVEKSTFYKWLAKEMKRVNPSSWVVRINLADCSAQLEQWLEQKSELNTNDAIDELMNMLKLAASTSSSEIEPFERKVFRWHCEQRKVIFLIDGFNEINADLTDMALQFIEIVRENFADKLWVITSFCEAQKELEETLRVRAFSLKYKEGRCKMLKSYQLR